MLTEQEIESLRRPLPRRSRLLALNSTSSATSLVRTDCLRGHLAATAAMKSSLSPSCCASPGNLSRPALTCSMTAGWHYAAAALVRQLVEVEYLAWAFDARDSDAERWLRSTAEERRDFFAPAKLRKAAQGKFRGKDYGHHCEMGGQSTVSLWPWQVDSTGKLLWAGLMIVSSTPSCE